MAEQILTVIEDIPVGETRDDSFTPAAGKKLIVKEFTASVPPGDSVTARLIWKYEHLTETEDTKWNIRSSASMPFRIEIPASDVDGVRKMGLLLESNEVDTPQAVSAIVRVEVI